MSVLVDRFAEMVARVKAASVEPCGPCDAGACTPCEGSGQTMELPTTATPGWAAAAQGKAVAPVKQGEPRLGDCYSCRGSGKCYLCGGTGETVFHEYSFKVLAAVLGSTFHAMAQFRGRQEFDYMHQFMDLALAWMARGAQVEIAELGPDAAREKFESIVANFADAVETVAVDREGRQGDTGPLAGALTSAELEELGIDPEATDG